MSIRNLGQIVLTAVIAFGFAGTAFADGHEEGYPISVSERPLTLDEGQMKVDASFGVSAFGDFMADSLNIGVSYGVMENLTVGANIAPLSLGLMDSEFGYGDPSIGALYRFMHGDLEVAGGVDIGIPVEGSLDVTVMIPVAYHMDALRLGTGLHVTLIGLDADLSTIIALPVEVGYNVTGDMHVSLQTGIMGNVDNFGDSLTIPVGVGLGYTVADGDAPMVDIGLGFSLPNVENTDMWAVGLTGNFHLWL
jgi:hypothetical protein